MNEFMYAVKEISLREHKMANFHLSVKLELNRSYFWEHDGGTHHEVSVLHCGAAMAYRRSSEHTPDLEGV